jgi:outer membrane receptor protein involved in Fe transport
MRSDDVTGRTSDNIGDIAPHKFNIILNTDFLKHFHINLRFNYVGDRETEISNPIKKVDAYFLTNLNLQVINLFENKLSLFVSVYNLFDIEYYHPGIDKANAGEDLSSPSNGWYSSRLPQPGRSIIFGMYLDL